ncbi:MAG: ParB/RepB/Spo0J family partition protein [Flavobacteriales bacterium]
MNNKRNALGRGLSAILRNPKTDITDDRTNEKNLVSNVNEIAIEDIQINPFQPRIDFEKEKIYELSESIKELGIIQPITVRKLGYNKYQLISGERRLRASKELNLKTIPSYIRIANDEQMLEMALVENIQREELNPVEIAFSYQRLMNECKLTQDKMSERVGKKRSTISNYLRLLKLPAEILAALKSKVISMGHARALINVSDIQTQLNIFRDAIDKKFSVREIEQIVKEFGNSSYKKNNNKSKSPTIPSFEHQKLNNDLKNATGKEIKLKVLKSGKGKIEISFNNEDELNEIVKYFGI